MYLTTLFYWAIGILIVLPIKESVRPILVRIPAELTISLMIGVVALLVYDMQTKDIMQAQMNQALVVYKQYRRVPCTHTIQTRYTSKYRHCSLLSSKQGHWCAIHDTDYLWNLVIKDKYHNEDDQTVARTEAGTTHMPDVWKQAKVNETIYSYMTFYTNPEGKQINPRYLTEVQQFLNAYATQYVNISYQAIYDHRAMAMSKQERQHWNQLILTQSALISQKEPVNVVLHIVDSQQNIAAFIKNNITASVNDVIIIAKVNSSNIIESSYVINSVNKTLQSTLGSALNGKTLNTEVVSVIGNELKLRYKHSNLVVENQIQLENFSKEYDTSSGMAGGILFVILMSYAAINIDYRRSRKKE